MLMCHIYCFVAWLFIQVKLDHMDRNLGKGTMDQQKNYEQVRYSTVETRNEGHGSANQRFFPDPSSNINTNMRPPDYNVAVGARPVLNYSIQTGEEFALEFMRERVNPRQHLVPHASGDPNSSPNFMDLKGILGISHTGSESGSDISLLNSVEKSRGQEFERKASYAHEDKSYYDSVRLPQTSSRNDINRGLSHVSSGLSDSSVRKLKFLCSFGGKILPRPSDGRLRYVGGETRIIRVNRDIFWQDLMQKMLTIYEQTRAIKYQLPGEDLDALVSVSCDEDLQNMMEECTVLQDGGSQKPRMFLFSSLDLEDSQFGVESIDGDPEIQYVVAVNGMDLGSRKNSIALASSSGNNLEELLSLNVARESTRAVPDTAGASTAPSAANVPSSTNQSSQSVLPGSSGAYESNSHPYQGQKMHSGEARQHPLTTFHAVESFPGKDGQTTVPSSAPLQYDFGSHPSHYATPGGNIDSMAIYGQSTQQGGLIEEQLYGGIHGQDSELPRKEVKLKRDSSAQKINEPEKIQSLEKEAPLKEARMKRESSLHKINESDKLRNLENENAVSLPPYDGSIPNYISRDEVSVANSAAETGSSLMATRSNKKLQEPRQNPITSEDVNDGKRNNEDDQFHTSSGPSNPGYGGSEVDSRYGGSEVDSMDFSYLEPPVAPQRVYHSERIPREQAELNRLSKSGDSFGSQFMIGQARSDHSQPIADSVDKLRDENVPLQSEQSGLPSKLLHVEDGLAQFEKYKEFAENINKMNSDAYPEGLEPKVQTPDLRHVAVNSVDGHEMGRLKDNYKDPTINDKEVAARTQLTAGQENSGKLKDSASVPSEFEWTEVAANKDQGNNAEGHAHPLSWTENPAKGVAHVQSTAGVGNPEQGDILIDINDRFPRDFLSDIFSKARISGDLSGMSPLPGDGTGLSLNMENHEPKHWSYFRNLAQNEFVRKDVSLMDQDHLGFPSPLTNLREGVAVDYSYPPLKPDGVVFGHTDSHINFDEDIRQESSGIASPNTMNLASEYNPSPPKGIESEQLDGVNHGIRESEYEDGELNTQNTGSLVDLSRGEFDISTLQIIENEDLEELKELGSGTFGTVYHGKWRGTDVAIKRIKKSCFTGRSSEQERLTVEFWREAEILSKLHHPNVVAFYGVVQNGPGGTLATVTEFMVNGSLRHVLLSKERHLDRRKRLIIAMDAAFGMEYLHSKNIVHFDLKCDNLLVNLKDPLRPICKVGDFGLSKIKRNTLVTGGVRGTLPWMAPELLNGSSSKVSEKVDVFSFGIVLWEILTGEEPYANMHYGAIIGGIVNNTLRPPVPGYCDSEWKLLMEQCWAADPIARPSFTEITRRLRVMSAACRTKPQVQGQSQVPK
ncbi:hypothetical protein PRUPE_4G114600 [Prunus persica]|uniref:Protein kinase domain-containing protein n=1 Tax=Prunus persica TaxID=3760 RepID=A0A251PJ44_PRUPE|nr:uncharacterized protein LOC18781339 [Prunus persica]ONI11582.1 hypothetical protein PRUPE_4G114600 [Prunus persica]